MRTLLLVVATAVASHQIPIRAAESVSWGPVANGLRMGVAVTAASSTGQLRLAFQNVGSEDLDVMLGGRTGIGPMYAMKFTLIPTAVSTIWAILEAPISSLGPSSRS